MTIIKHRDSGLVGTPCGACMRQRLGATAMFMLLGLVGTLCGSGGASAQKNFNPLPPPVAFISDGKYTGTLQIQGKTLPITGTLNFLAGVTEYLKISVTEGLITSDSWAILLASPPVFNEWEIVSTDPTTCRKEVLSGASFPQCTAWSRTPRGIYTQECTVTALGNNVTLDSFVTLTADNMLVNLQENATITGENNNSQVNETTNSLTITMTEQGSSAPAPSDFNRPSICNAPNGNNNNQGQKVCTGTFPNICF